RRIGPGIAQLARSLRRLSRRAKSAKAVGRPGQLTRSAGSGPAGGRAVVRRVRRRTGPDGERHPQGPAGGRTGQSRTGGAVMEPEEPPPEEQYTALFAAGEEALVAGQTAEACGLSAAPAELRPRLEDDLACARLLHQVLRQSAAGVAD